MAELAVPDTHHSPDQGMWFFVLALLMGVLIRVVQRMSRFNMPYAVVLLLVGVLLGLVDKWADLGFASDSIQTWKRIQGHGLVLMFLPPLLFASSSTVNFHVFRRLAAQAVLLAVPGVLISSFLTALVGMFVLPHGWDLASSMLVGAMFSATDPVAVVALLKELGAPETLSVLIEGESLLNDGIAFALFLVFLSVQTGNAPTGGEMVWEVVYSSLVGVLVGAVLALLTLKSVGFIWNDSVLEISLSISMTWGVFLVGDALNASGVLAVVAFGLVFSSQSQSNLSAEVHHAMHDFWHMLEFIANTLIFVFSGIVCAESLTEHLIWKHLAFLVVLYIMLNLIRFAVVAIFYVPLCKLGYGMDRKRALMVSWSGLRGAVGLVAAIEVREMPTCQREGQEGCVEESFQQLVMFYMSGIVILTILINGTTTQYLVSWLEIAKRSQAAKRNFDASIDRINDAIAEHIAEAKEKPELAGVDWNVVWRNMPALNVDSVQNREEHCALVDQAASLAEKTKLGKLDRGNYLARQAGEEDFLAEARYRFLSLVKANYRHQFDVGLCGSWPALHVLNEAAARCLDDLQEPLNEWHGFVAKHCSVHDWTEGCGWIRGKRTHIAQAYDIAFSFIKAHEYAESKLDQIAGREDCILDVAAKVHAESTAMLKEARRFLRDADRAYEDVTASLKTGMVVSKTLRHTVHLVHEMFDKAEIDESDFEIIHRELSKRILQVRRSNGYVEVRAARDLFRAMPFFDGVDENTINRVRRHAVLRKFDAGELLIERGASKGNVFLVIRGQVSFALERKPLAQLADLKRPFSSLHTQLSAKSLIGARQAGRAASTATMLETTAAPPSSAVREPDPHTDECLGHRILGRDQNAASENEHVTYTLGRGETVGELEVFGNCSVMADVAATSLVEVFEIDRDWLTQFFKENPDHKLHSNFIRHTALIAIESFFPVLRTAPASLRAYLLRKLEVFSPPADTPCRPLEGAGISVILRGSLKSIGGHRFKTAVAAITVLDLPSDEQTYDHGTLLVLLPNTATSLLRVTHSSNSVVAAARGGDEAEQVDQREHKTATRHMSINMGRAVSFLRHGLKEPQSIKPVDSAQGDNNDVDDDEDDDWLSDEEHAYVTDEFQLDLN